LARRCTNSHFSRTACEYCLLTSTHTHAHTHIHIHTHTYTHTHTRTYTKTHSHAIGQKGAWEASDTYILKDKLNPDIDFSGTRAKGGARATGKAKAGGGKIFESLKFLRLENFEMGQDDCKVREGGGEGRNM